MSSSENVTESRLKQLENHLERENPVLLSTVQSFRQLDQIAYRMGILDTDASFATQIPWWPLISILGTFSAGKSTFINHYIGSKLQRSGNQAVDDKFSVICFSENENSQTLPGVALDSDPRFPFYKMSSEIEAVAAGEGDRIDAYLQLKTIKSEALRGKILIDSPGFDADAQRTSTLKITDHIIDLSDLVLVFFDARHPEPGAMRDTLDQLVSNTIKRTDPSKFLYILNQIDTTAGEDNPEEVIAAWQRAMGERGLTAGRFFSIYNSDVAIPIENEALRARYESKRDKDLAEIHQRINGVEIERAYRIVGSLEKTARHLDEQIRPSLTDAIQRWKKRVMFGDALLFGASIVAFLAITIKLGHWQDVSIQAEWWNWVTASKENTYISAVGSYAFFIILHYFSRNLAARSLTKWLKLQQEKLGGKINLIQAFSLNTRAWRSIFAKNPVGWNNKTKRSITAVINSTDDYVQKLNDNFTNPSGEDSPLVDPISADVLTVEKITAEH